MKTEEKLKLSIKELTARISVPFYERHREELDELLQKLNIAGHNLRVREAAKLRR